jgi:hypothetical protein
MATEYKPSTGWKEKIAPDEAQRYEGYANDFAAIQARKSKKYGVGRGLHRKQLTAAQGTLEVLPKLPTFASQGLFASPGKYDVWVRLSNGGMDSVSDKRPDVRGFAFRVMGVQGESALGIGPAVSQDFTLINQEVFAFPNSAEFVGFVVAASKGGGDLLKFLFKTYGLLGAPIRLGKMIRSMGKAFSGFATENLFSAAPISSGPYAVRVRLVPSDENGPARAGANADWGADFNTQLRLKTLQWDLQLQPFVSEDITPIENPSINWPTPYTTVARLTLPQQDTASVDGQAFAKTAEACVIDPWQALVAHRPLGDVMRARKVVYFASQKGRNAA